MITGYTGTWGTEEVDVIACLYRLRSTPPSPPRPFTGTAPSRNKPMVRKPCGDLTQEDRIGLRTTVALAFALF
jgi:hypothetical protein